jgi:hypothetical protein
VLLRELQRPICAASSALSLDAPVILHSSQCYRSKTCSAIQRPTIALLTLYCTRRNICVPEDLTSQDSIYRLTMVTGQEVSTRDPLRVLPETQVHTNIFIGELVGQTHALGLVLD